MTYRTEYTPTDAPRSITDGQRVSCAHRSWMARRAGVVLTVVPPAAAAGHDYTAYVVEYPPSNNEHPAVQALAIYGGMHRGLFRAEELEPVSPDVAPTGGATWWECPRPDCTTVIGEAGPVDPHDDYDPVREHVEGHERDDERRGETVPAHEAVHPRRALDDGWGHVPALTLWAEVLQVPELIDALAAVARAVTPAQGAAILRAAANVLDGGAK